MMTTARILIVEDERIVAIDLQRRLVRMGYRVVAIAASGPEAIDKAQALRPDLILMDIRLQGRMDGVEAAQHIHAHMRMPIVFMTAYVDETTMQRARAVTPWGCLRKPFDTRTVQITIESALGGQPTDTR
jgi:CheY-like chemotaxis protein